MDLFKLSERALRPNRMYWRQGIYLNWSPEAYCLVGSEVLDNRPESFLKITVPSCRKGEEINYMLSPALPMTHRHGDLSYLEGCRKTQSPGIQNKSTSPNPVHFQFFFSIFVTVARLVSTFVLCLILKVFQ